ncbi:hypothetical protein NG800_017885 [Epilithonimonas ginsengisoli]|uniref:Uncharacterized protein n=1 Tax=Epilithonimonas ginsengisoli TaxID=1245592 RepID=A0ABU4JMC4_9FLAO|nr:MULTISPECIES: hypothetical protein [Chryseobacterium group]MBV6880500.1 recombinase family protein [Epilithonimonas sp. FP105]MDW8550802.1 hypothetical protein [Epilithonimonas ginsengisoli]OAH69168.1 hypothetical protein AXA65_15160 [Chryseobacterium sp. FP211-J200]
MEASIIIHPRNRKEASLLKKVLKALDAQFVFKEEKSESLSPSDDPYFDIPENVAELERRIENLKTGKSKSKILSIEAQKELLGL